MGFESFPTGPLKNRKESTSLTEGERDAIGEHVEASERRRKENGIPVSEERNELYDRTRERLTKKIILLMVAAGAGIGTVAEKMDTTKEKIEQSPALSMKYNALKSHVLEACLWGATPTQVCHQAIDNMDNFLDRNQLSGPTHKTLSKALKVAATVYHFPN